MRLGNAVAALLVGAVFAGTAPSGAAPLSRDVPPTACPLTGRKLPAGASARRPAVAVKVDNGPSAAAPSIEKADVVFESLVEGGITRLTAIFHCRDAGTVGAVRSARADDPGFVMPLTRVLAYSGANRYVAEELDAAGVVSITEAAASAAFRRSGSDLAVDTAAVRAATRGANLAAPPALPFGEVQGRTDARVVKLGFAATKVEYRWKDAAWRRFQNGAPFMLENDKQASADNVLVWEVDVDLSTEVFDSFGTPSPELALRGSGRAFLFRNGRVVKGTWTSVSGRRLPVFKTKGGTPLLLSKGVTWIEMVPSSAGEVTGSVSFR